VLAGLQLDPKRTVADWLDYWASEVLPTEGLAPGTVRNYVASARLYVTPHIGKMKLIELRPEHVEKMTSDLDKKGLGHRVQVRARGTLGKALRCAESRRIVAFNAARLARPPKSKGELKVIKSFSPAEVQQLLDGLSGQWATMTKVACGTGLRPAELCALQWDAVTLDGPQPVVQVRQAMTWGPGGIATIKAVKRQRSNRAVPLSQSIVDVLREHRAQHGEREFVFTRDDGSARRTDAWRREMH
jgi:integrase